MDIVVTRITKTRKGRDKREGALINADGGVLVGRGSNCQLALRDRSVELEHARIEVVGDEILLKRIAGFVTINGLALQQEAGKRIVVGDRIIIGKYQILAVEPSDGAILGLDITQSEADTEVSSQKAHIEPQRLSKRRLAYQAFFWTLLGFLILPVTLDQIKSHREGKQDWVFAHLGLSNVAGPADGTAHPVLKDDFLIPDLFARFMRAWEPGPLMRAHHVTQGDCQACHAESFQKVRDRECQKCHELIRDHVPRTVYTSEKGKNISNERCSRCHLDHAGPQREAHPQTFCVQCHGDIKAIAELRGLPDKDARGNVRDFGLPPHHAEFRITIEDPPVAPSIETTSRRVRLDQKVERMRRDQGEAPECSTLKGHHEALVECSNLKFNHKVHLDKKGIRGPKDQASRILGCVDCHKPDETGARMAPVRMAEHCAECHRLEFEPAVSDRQVPHGKEALMLDTLREFYARLVLGDLSDGLRFNAETRERPGRILTPEDRSRASELAERKTAIALEELYVTRQVCSTCHKVELVAGPKSGESRWRVAKVHLTRQWMPYAQFTHAKHRVVRDVSACGSDAKDCNAPSRELACTYCHEVENSNRAADIAMPSIRACESCHGGGTETRGDRVRSECATCHLYHGVRERLTTKTRQTMAGSTK